MDSNHSSPYAYISASPGGVSRLKSFILRRKWFVLAIGLILIAGGIVLIIAAKSRPAVSEAVPSVVVSETGFRPQTIKIKKGQRVTWINQDANPHQISADPHPSGDLLPTLKSREPLLQYETYTAIFEKSGTFTYHDFLNPVEFQATVIVEE